MEILSSWVIMAFFASLFNAAWRLVSEYFKVDNKALIFWRGAFPALYASPILFFIPWPKDPLFYVFVISVACIVTFTDVILFDITKKYGAGVPSRLQPLGILLSFIAWFLIDTNQIDLYLEKPVITVGIITSLLMIVFTTTRLRRCTISKEVFIQMVPVIIATSAAGILIKMGLAHAESSNQAVGYYILVQGTAIAIFVAIRESIKRRRLNRILDKDVLKAGFVIGLLTPCSVFCAAHAFIAADNPAYVSAVILLSPFWIVLIYKSLNKKEQGDVKTGLLLVASVIALVLFKGML